MLSLERITKWVNTGSGRIFLLRDINMSIAKGEFVSIMGPSGSGKSTVFEFNESKTKYATSLSQQARAKYNFIFKAKILDFYNGVEIKL